MSKKNRLKIGLYFILLTILSLNGCNTNGNGNLSSNAKDDSSMPIVKNDGYSLQSAESSQVPESVSQPIKDQITLDTIRNAEAAEYRIDKVRYEVNPNYWAEYPQISFMTDKKIQNKINKDIQDHVFTNEETLGYVGFIIEDEIVPTDYTMDYEIKLSNSQCVSFVFHTGRQYENAAWASTSNLGLSYNVKTGDLISLDQLYDNTDDFKSKIVEADYVGETDNENWEYLSVLAHIKGSYFLPDKLGVILEVPPSRGDMCGEIPYEDIVEWEK